MKLAVLTSHPIQYQVPLFEKLTKHSEVDMTVYFCWNFGVHGASFDPEFGKKLKWDIPLLSGYRYLFLKNFSLKPSSGFWGQINLGIIKELVNKRYDAIMIFGWNSLTNWLAFLTAFLTGTPVLMRGENPMNQELVKSGPKRRIKKFILGWLFRGISAFLYIGEENKKFYEYYGVPRSKLFFVPYAVDNDRFIAAREEEKVKVSPLKKEIGVSPDKAVILFMGKLIEKKRPMDLLKAYEILATKHQLPAASLIFVGDGILRAELERYVEEHNIKDVYFIGFKNQTELPQYYALADIFVLPSSYGETWGLVVNEAMCFRLPVIVSDLAGSSKDLVEQGKNGYVFPVGDVNDLAMYLSELVRSKEKREQFGKRSFEIIQNYSYEKDILGILHALKDTTKSI